MHRIIAAVKKLVVGFVSILWNPSGVSGCYRFYRNSASNRRIRLNDRAWNNRKRFRFSFIGFTD
ncbi:hypothetical protein Mgra_00010207 [Meloidogyne graminicola]|uniref:Secreted protein n=1 Tax=Meloidogyne graminicola TaxID=189291 RepID=A0A8S9ZCQ0_9BILA|nr:hypothetical protein Mgra_00010207 [Meloidogyne graminicola]